MVKITKIKRILFVLLMECGACCTAATMIQQRAQHDGAEMVLLANDEALPQNEINFIQSVIMIKSGIDDILFAARSLSDFESLLGLPHSDFCDNSISQQNCALVTMSKGINILHTCLGNSLLGQIPRIISFLLAGINKIHCGFCRCLSHRDEEGISSCSKCP